MHIQYCICAALSHSILSRQQNIEKAEVKSQHVSNINLSQDDREDTIANLSNLFLEIQF